MDQIHLTVAYKSDGDHDTHLDVLGISDKVNDDHAGFPELLSLQGQSGL